MMFEKKKNLAEKGWECQRVTILKTVARNVLTEKKTSESSLGAERARLRDSEKYSGREMAGCKGPEAGTPQHVQNSEKARAVRVE